MARRVALSRTQEKHCRVLQLVPHQAFTFISCLEPTSPERTKIQEPGYGASEGQACTAEGGPRPAWGAGSRRGARCQAGPVVGACLSGLSAAFRPRQPTQRPVLQAAGRARASVGSRAGVSCWPVARPAVNGKPPLPGTASWTSSAHGASLPERAENTGSE